MTAGDDCFIVACMFFRPRSAVKSHALAAAIVAATPLPANAAWFDSPALTSVFPLLVLSLMLVIIGFAVRHFRSAKAGLAGNNALLALSTFETGYYLLDLEHEHEDVSPGMRRLLGLTETLVNFQHFTLKWESHSAERLQVALTNLREDETIKSFQVETLDGRRRYECRGQVVSRTSGKPKLLVLWFFDITSHFRSQHQLISENEKLKSEIRNYSTILNMAPYPIWQRGDNLQVRYYNLSYSEVAEEADVRDETREVPELDSKAKLLAKQALDAGEPRSERRHIIVGGERKLFQLNEYPVPEENMLVGFAQDVTEVEHLREELQRHISAQSDLLESSASAMAIYGADMRLSTFNYAFVTLWKLEEPWLETHPLYGEVLESLREKRKLPEQANFQSFKQQQVRLFTELIEPQEEFFYLPDGKVLRVIAIPHALGGILFAYEDVTDRLALERSYNTLIAVQRETLDNLHEGVAVLGEDGRLKLSNPGFFKLWQVDKNTADAEPHINELVEQWKPMFASTEWDAARDQFLQQIQNRQHGVYRMERADGKVLNWATVPLPDGATLVTFLDVTDSTLVERSLREKNEALQEADRLKSEFLANVSYELRSPLTSISGFSEMLRQEYFGTLSEKQVEYVEGIHQSSQHLMQLINDILDLASIEAGYMRLEAARFDIHTMMQSVFSLIQERVKEFNIKVKFNCPQKIGKMLGDETRIKQILFNLLSNAINYSQSGDSIDFGADEQDKDHVRFWVQDQGEGMSPEEQKAIFDRFFRSRKRDNLKSGASVKPGTGLGLTIVKSFIELHGGKVTLESTPGKGTKLICIVPRNNPDLQQHVKSTRRNGATS